MASFASLLMLLAVAFPIIQSISNHSAQDTFPHGHPAQETPQTENPDLQFCWEVEGTTKISRTCCPPFGSSDDRFNVTVMGTLSSTIVGSAYMKKTHPEKEPAFSLWLGDLETDSESYDDEEEEFADLNLQSITHATFYCLSKHRFIDEDKNIEGWYVTLFEPFNKWSNRSHFYCALYSMLKEDPPMIQMVISANSSCDGLAATMANIEQQRVPKGHRHFEDGSTALLFSKEFPEPISALDD